MAVTARSGRKGLATLPTNAPLDVEIDIGLVPAVCVEQQNLRCGSCVFAPVLLWDFTHVTSAERKLGRVALLLLRNPILLRFIFRHRDTPASCGSSLRSRIFFESSRGTGLLAKRHPRVAIGLKTTKTLACHTETGAGHAAALARNTYTPWHIPAHTPAHVCHHRRLHPCVFQIAAPLITFKFPTRRGETKNQRGLQRGVKALMFRSSTFFQVVYVLAIQGSCLVHTHPKTNNPLPVPNNLQLVTREHTYQNATCWPGVETTSGDSTDRRAWAEKKR